MENCTVGLENSYFISCAVHHVPSQLLTYKRAFHASSQLLWLSNLKFRRIFVLPKGNKHLDKNFPVLFFKCCFSEIKEKKRERKKPMNSLIWMERREKPVFGLKMSTVKHFVAAGLQLFQLFGHFLFFLSEALKKFFLCVHAELHFKNCSHRLCLPICSHRLYLVTY